MTLLIISHTPHYAKDGVVLGFGPTVREINNLTTLFDRIYHIAPLYTENATPIVTPYNEKVKFVPLSPVGGVGILNKLRIFTHAFLILSVVKKTLKEVDVFQFRAPTAIGVYLIPYLMLFTRKKGWFKYAGNWNAQDMPISYGFQKFLLKYLTKRKVTINGTWPGLRSNFISFENPCLSDGELIEGKEYAQGKTFSDKLSVLFVGRIEKEKGVDILFQMMNHLQRAKDIGELVLVGEGDITKYEPILEKKIKVVFTGGLSREEINVYYKKAHILILPSLAEGFPKVVAEAAAYGCIPAVSDVSALSQYVAEENGLVFRNFDPVEMAKQFDALLSDRLGLKAKSDRVLRLAQSFTYSHYIKRIQNELIV